MSTVIGKYLDKILNASDEARIYAYRGQRNADWALHSGATRRLIDEYGDGVVFDQEFSEKYVDYHTFNLINPARTSGYGIEDGRNLSDLELLAKLQHFGAATGLLDFTRSPLVALWFAAEDIDHDGKVFMIDTNDPIRIAKVLDGQSAQLLHSVFVPSPGSQSVSFWEPTRSGDALPRILLQRSVFIIGRPLVDLGNGVVGEVVIEKDDKKSLIAELSALDINQETLFQDVYGFAQASKMRRVPGLSAAAHNRLGNRHYQLGEDGQALEAYNRSIALEPDAGLTYFLRANVLAALGRHVEAINDYTTAEGHDTILQRGIRDAVVYNRGNSKAEIGDVRAAIDDYSEAIALDPNAYQYYFNRGNAHIDLDGFPEAVEDFRMATQIGLATGWPEESAMFNQGFALLAMGKFREARDCFQEAVTMGVNLVMGKFKEARDCFQGAVTMEVNLPGSVHNLGTLNRIIVLVIGLDYSVDIERDSATGTACLTVRLKPGYEPVSRELQGLSLSGRGGNVGNTGGPGLGGGKGFQGKPIWGVRSDLMERDSL